MQDLHQLPKLGDSMSYLYLEHCIIEQKDSAVEKIDQSGRTMIPAANLTVLLLGPGTNITHAAVKSLADNGCGIVWVGEEATYFYAHGSGETRRAYHLLHQARLVSNPRLRLAVCKRMYRKRFIEKLDENLSILRLRGKEGARVRMAYEKASILHHVPWHGRNYDRKNWGNSDPINRALSTANALLYGVCHAAIVSGGYSPALGFIHTGKQRSFVYDIADLYKVDLTIPTAFRVVGESTRQISPRVRVACREAFREFGLLKRILPDIADILEVQDKTLEAASNTDVDAACPEPLWAPADESVSGEEKASDSLLLEQLEDETWVPVPVDDDDMQETEPDLKTIPFEEKEEQDALQVRKQRAEVGLNTNWKVKSETENSWRVLTTSGPPGYLVTEKEENWECTCPDFERNELGDCKHTLAVKLWQERGAA
jgi:CRISPR-associated protein Cas1